MGISRQEAAVLSRTSYQKKQQSYWNWIFKWVDFQW